MAQQKVLSSVHNAIRILQEFSPDEQELGISELSSRLGMAKSTVFRLIRTLSEFNLVQKNEETQKYHLGMAAFELGFKVYHTMELRMAALPLVEKLMQSMRKVIRLGVYDRGGILYVCKRPYSDEATVSKIGNRAPAHCTSVGKVLLAYQEEEEIEKVLQEPMGRYTDTTITDPAALRQHLAEIRESGYTVNYGELRENMYSVAVPVYNHAGKVIAALSATSFKSSFYSGQTSHYVKELKDYSRLITENLDLYVNEFR